MSSIVQQLIKQKLINPPKYVHDNMCYEVFMGSMAYGLSENNSDVDIYGFCIPLKEEIFPHLNGYIEGFGKKLNRFEQFQQHHVQYNAKEYDMSIYSIVKYFNLCLENNPNMLDSLFVPSECIIYCTSIGKMVRDNRHIFLHKGSYHKLVAYAFSQLHKMKSREPVGKRKDLIEKMGFDTKYAYHLVRLSNEAEQILKDHDLDLRKGNEYLKAIRRGEVKEQDIYDWFSEKEKYLLKLYHESTLREYPDEAKVKQLLLDCLEHHYGSLEKCIYVEKDLEKPLREIKAILEKYNV